MLGGGGAGGYGEMHALCNKFDSYTGAGGERAFRTILPCVTWHMAFVDYNQIATGSDRSGHVFVVFTGLQKNSVPQPRMTKKHVTASLLQHNSNDPTNNRTSTIKKRGGGGNTENHSNKE